jgi:Holliday junction resolvasome RuvABC endonuclease subunit
MNQTRLRPAHLDTDGLGRLRQLEQEIGSVIIAYHPESPYAGLTTDQVQRLKALEDELGLVLLAYNPREAAVGE